MKDKTDVWQGTLALMVLKTLHALGPLHGYGIARRIEALRAKGVPAVHGDASEPEALVRVEGLCRRFGAEDGFFARCAAEAADIVVMHGIPRAIAARRPRGISSLCPRRCHRLGP